MVKISKFPGFTIYELMISIFILMLIAGAAVFNLRTTSMKDELNTATRVVAADLRSLQSRALSAQNLKTCLDSSGAYIVCENETTYCQDPATCSQKPPYGVGVLFRIGGDIYHFFADVDQASNDWIKSSEREVYQIRDLKLNGAPNVFISELFTSASVGMANVAFQRQNGSMGIEGCYAPCVSPAALTITLKHRITNETKSIYLNAYTGRISIQ